MSVSRLFSLLQLRALLIPSPEQRHRPRERHWPISSTSCAIGPKSWNPVRACAQVSSRSHPLTRSRPIPSAIPILSSCACSTKPRGTPGFGICTGPSRTCRRIPIRSGVSGRLRESSRHKLQRQRRSAMNSRLYSPFWWNEWECERSASSGLIRTTPSQRGCCIPLVERRCE